MNLQTALDTLSGIVSALFFWGSGVTMMWRAHKHRHTVHMHAKGRRLESMYAQTARVSQLQKQSISTSRCNRISNTYYLVCHKSEVNGHSAKRKLTCLIYTDTLDLSALTRNVNSCRLWITPLSCNSRFKLQLIHNLRRDHKIYQNPRCLPWGVANQIRKWRYQSEHELIHD